MEEKEVQKEETKEVKETTEIPKGYYLAKIPTEYGVVMMKGEEKISFEELVVKMANAVEEAGLFK